MFKFLGGRYTRWTSGAVLVTGTLLMSSSGAMLASAAMAPRPLEARIVASGIPGVGPLTQVGDFQPGGPIHDNAAMAALTAPGAILDPERLLVGSSSNFGAPGRDPSMQPGSVLSIDPRGPSIDVPTEFAARGGQTTTAGGRVQLYTAQSAAFANSIYNPDAVTANLGAVSHPLAISLNNAFGRIWIANMPWGPDGAGTETIVDPDGRPLASAPDAVAGGVFSDIRTNRADQQIDGNLNSVATGTALLGHSPDGKGRAVFVVSEADGSLVQVHSEMGLDGLAPSGTLAPLSADDLARGLRAGTVFNWVPDRIVYVADPLRNGVTAVTLGDNGSVFVVESTRLITSADFDEPIDLTPAVPEIANPAFSSNTSLAAGSDIYVLNRGSGTVARMTQEGTVRDVRQVTLPGGQPVGGGRLSGIAVSDDADRIWLSVQDASDSRANGLVLELPAFGAPNTL